MAPIARATKEVTKAALHAGRTVTAAGKCQRVMLIAVDDGHFKIDFERRGSYWSLFHGKCLCDEQSAALILGSFFAKPRQSYTI
jgi:hypothetical protein